MIEEQTAKKNYNGIDLAKFICSLLVVVIHIAPFGSTENNTLKYLNFGTQNYLARVAVPFFFMASGFFLYRKTDKDNFNISHTKKYIVRLLKLYLIWTAIYSPLIIKYIIKGEKGIIHGILNFIRNCIFSGTYTQFWYLNGLIVAVIIISFLLYKKVKPNNIIAISIVLYIIGLFGISYCGLLLPIKNTMPKLWDILKMIKKVMGTTRNGLFFGFFFVSLGMGIAYYGNKTKKDEAIIGFIISMILFGLEIFVLRYNKLKILMYDMFIFLVPATYFFFSYFHQLKMKDHVIYKKLRIMSSLIFYSHLWVSFVVSNIIKRINVELSKTCLCFVATVIITISLSYLIYWLSQKEKYKILQRLY